MITLGKRGDLHACVVKQLLTLHGTKVASKKLDEETGKYSETTALQIVL